MLKCSGSIHASFSILSMYMYLRISNPRLHPHTAFFLGFIPHNRKHEEQYLYINHTYIYIYVSIYLSIYAYTYLCIYLSMHIPTYLSIYLSMQIPTYLPIYLSIFLFTYAYIYILIIALSICKNEKRISIWYLGK